MTQALIAPSARSLADLMASTRGATTQNSLDPQQPRDVGSFAPDSAGAGHANQQPDLLRVVSDNVEFGRKIDRALAVLRGQPFVQSADIYSLQEMSPLPATSTRAGRARDSRG